MNPFRPPLPITEKSIEQHPWGRFIKDAYCSKIKYAHNSIHNPVYPKKTEKKKDVGVEKKIKFTVIGDRVTKQFIYCSNLVRGLHKYRKNAFDSPTIKGVTTVEWPRVLKELQVQFKGPAFCLTSSVAILKDDELLGGEHELTKYVNSRYKYHFSLDYPKQAIEEFAKFIRRSGRACAYMHIAIDNEPIGPLIFMLYDDIVPNTCINFLRLCNQTKGGYSGTPIHRIVKDGWIQGGGYGLKETDLCCENFIVPHDRRGVLCMANSGLHMECSTQFFVLLQPAPWMDKKFVAFGQLIEGKATLDKIESVPTWCESPKSEIIIYKAGILNLECQNIIISKGTNDYIFNHIDDLNEIGKLFYAELMQNVFLTAQMRELQRLQAQQGEETKLEEEEDANAIRETRRFNRKKEDIEKQLQSSKASVSRPATASTQQTLQSSNTKGNDEFDVETYDLEESELCQSVVASNVGKAAMPFYISLTDVYYPGEKDSEFDLKRFLQGDYCLESDLTQPARTFIPNREQVEYLTDLYFEEDHDSDEYDSDAEKEIKKYLRNQMDQVSFAGEIIKKICKDKNKASYDQKVQPITDEHLRRIRLASLGMKNRDEKKVPISMLNPEDIGKRAKIKIRQTGFVKMPAVLDEVREHKTYNDEINDQRDKTADQKRKVRIFQQDERNSRQVQRRPTAFIRPAQYRSHSSDETDDDDGSENNDELRHSALVRLFDEVEDLDKPPRLKDYKPLVGRSKNLLMFSSNYRIKSDNENRREKYNIHHSLTLANESDSYDNVLNIQHGKQLTRKISSDYVKTIGQMEHKLEKSIRSVEYAKTRPAISVDEYKAMNKMYNVQKKYQK